jgi:hypothetical protein
MNIFNKVIMVLILICIICISLVAVFNEFADFFQWSDFALRIFNPQVDIPTYITVLAAITVFAVSVVLLLLELYRRKSKVANISSSKEGNVMITLDTVASQIKNETLKVDGLKDIKVKIVPKATGIIINMYAKLKEDIDIPSIMQEIVKSATNIASEKLGIKVIKINLTTTGLAGEKKEVELGKEEEQIQEKAEEEEPEQEEE